MIPLLRVGKRMDRIKFTIGEIIAEIGEFPKKGKIRKIKKIIPYEERDSQSE